MISREKIRDAIRDVTGRNPDWKEALVAAPGAAGLRIALAFYASENLEGMTGQEKDEYREFREQLEAKLDAEELKYLEATFGRMGLEAAKEHYGQLAAERGRAAQ